MVKAGWKEREHNKDIRFILKHMTPIIINNDAFWRWMSPESDNLNYYLDCIAENQVDKDYMIDLLKENTFQTCSSIMEKLSLSMPREYFLEVQFCAKTYATFFGQVFPPFVSHVDQLAYIEWLLYTEPDNVRYRDHLVHMFKVAFVIDNLLSIEEIFDKIVDWQFGSKHFKEWCEMRHFQTERDIKTVKMACFLAALFHDFGYGYYFLKQYKERLFKLYEWLLPEADPMDISASNTQTLLQSLPAYFIKEHHGWLNQMNSDKEKDKQLTKRDKLCVAGFFHDCLPLNHSTASTIFILDIAEKLWRSRAINQKLYIAFQLAAEATLIHDMTDKKKWAHLKGKISDHFISAKSHTSIPLAILLILSDELACWKRHRIKNELIENGVIYKIDKENVIKEIEISVSDGEITIRPKGDNKNSLRKIFKKELPFFKGSLFGYKINIKSSKKF